MEIDKTVKAVFDRAMHLLDETNWTSGETDTPDTREYKVRTLGILNTLLSEAYRASTTYDPARPHPDVTAFTDELELDDTVVRALPYRLAAELVKTDDLMLCNAYLAQYAQLLAAARAQQTASFEEAETPYGGIEYGEFARW